jgi:hypothetical protein
MLMCVGVLMILGIYFDLSFPFVFPKLFPYKSLCSIFCKLQLCKTLFAFLYEFSIMKIMFC